jgi:TIR domain
MQSTAINAAQTLDWILLIAAVLAVFFFVRRRMGAKGALHRASSDNPHSTRTQASAHSKRESAPREPIKSEPSVKGQSKTSHTSKVFISHSHKDQGAAETLYTALENRGLQCWFAPRDVSPGENFQESIHRAIRSARVMVLVFTKNANNSSEINKELALAGQYELLVIPVRVEDVVPNDALAYELATRQWIDLFRDWERAIERLSSRIAAIVSTETGTAPTQ